jgi:helix-turn-helix protein
MTAAQLSRKDFDRKRLQLADRLRRDASKTPSARLVGADIIARANLVTGDCWASEATLAKDLGLTARTIKRAIHDLRGNYIEVEKCGRSNRYRPNFALVDDPRLPLAGGTDMTAIGDKNDSDRGQKRPGIGDKSDPQTLIENSKLNPSTGVRGEHPATNRRSEAVTPPHCSRWEEGDRLTEQQDDGAVEIEAARLMGPSGFEVIGNLHALGDGQPRLRLLSLVRNGTATPQDLHAARLAAGFSQSRSRR